MARPLRINYPGAFYHVTSRGNENPLRFKTPGVFVYGAKNIKWKLI